MKILGIILLAIVLITVSSLINGWTISVLWDWFIVPLFGLPSLSIPAAIGLAIVVGYFALGSEHMKKSESDDETVTDKLLRAVIWMIMKPVFTLLIGFIVVQFL